MSNLIFFSPLLFIVLFQCYLVTLIKAENNRNRHDLVTRTYAIVEQDRRYRVTSNTKTKTSRVITRATCTDGLDFVRRVLA